MPSLLNFSLLNFERTFTGKGFHKILKTIVRFKVHGNFPVIYSKYFYLSYLAKAITLCEVQLVETLPSGIYVDVYELDNIVNRSEVEM
jgi:hypothetical protein